MRNIPIYYNKRLNLFRLYQVSSTCCHNLPSVSQVKNEGNSLKIYDNLLNMPGYQFNILLSYFLLQICWFLILNDFLLNIAIMCNSGGNYFFVTYGDAV